MTKKGSREKGTSNEIEEKPTDVADLTPAGQASHLAGLQFTMAEVAKILGCPLDDALIMAYERGALLEEAKVREAIKRMAVRGSSPAQKQYSDMTAEAKRGNVNYRKSRDYEAKK